MTTVFPESCFLLEKMNTLQTLYVSSDFNKKERNRDVERWQLRADKSAVEPFKTPSSETLLVLNAAQTLLHYVLFTSI